MVVVWLYLKYLWCRLMVLHYTGRANAVRNENLELERRIRELERRE